MRMASKKPKTQIVVSKKIMAYALDAHFLCVSGKFRVRHLVTAYGNHCSSQSHCFLNVVHKFQFHAFVFPNLFFSALILPFPQYPQWKRQGMQTLSEKMLMVRSVRFTLWWSWQRHSFNLILEVPRGKGYGYCKILKILQCACEYIINGTNDLVFWLLLIVMLC